MPELGTFGSVGGVPGDGHPYRNPRCVAAAQDIKPNDRNASTAGLLVSIVLPGIRHSQLLVKVLTVAYTRSGRYLVLER
jgi:hypothetical protein